MQAHVKPGVNLPENKLNLFDDFTIVLVLDCLVCCTDLLHDGRARYAVGFLIVYLTLQNLLINLALLAY